MGTRGRRARLVGTFAAFLLAGSACQGDDTDPTQTAPDGSTETANSATTEPPSPTPTPTTPHLLPNMQSLAAADVHIDVTDDGRDLRFAATLANVGDGPLILRPDEEPECPEGQRHASQLIPIDSDGDGSFDPDVDTDTEQNPAGCMLFHPTHEHWHFDASASYVLTEPDGETPVVSTDKVSFCMRDSRRLPGERWEDAPETYGECERDQIQGITAGWGDVYESELDGQALPLPDDLADGTYCLQLTADPFDLLLETVEDDNATTVAVELAGDEATRNLDSDACAS